MGSVLLLAEKGRRAEEGRGDGADEAGDGLFEVPPPEDEPGEAPLRDT